MHPEELLTDTNSPVTSEASEPKSGARSRSAARKAKSKHTRCRLNKKTTSTGPANPEAGTNGNQVDTEGTQQFIEQRSQEAQVNGASEGAYPGPSPSLQGSSEETHTPTEDYATENRSPETVADELESSLVQSTAQETDDAAVSEAESFSGNGGTESGKEMEPLPRVEEALPAALTQVIHIDKLGIEANNLEQSFNANTIQQQIITETLHQQVTLAPDLGEEEGEGESSAQTGLSRLSGDDAIPAIVASPGISGKMMRANLPAVSRGTSLKARSRWVSEAGQASPIIRAVETIIEGAIAEGASDIHLEPQEEELVVRYRIDGILRQAQILPVGIHQSLISRVKVMANMDISEHRVPQDGQFTYSIQGHDVDFRVASIDTNHGEMVVMRLLDKSVSFLQLSEIAMRPDILELYYSILEAPYGMVLASGPTGFDKTTSLYASLRHFDHKDTKIMTVEDPIEYKIPGISQIQVNRQAGATFSTGLRGILRLDPDVILVGEVRDSETAEIAVQAALTGHMVLSSIHANDAAGALLRLVNLGVEPFLVNSAVMCSIAQRLVRKPCVHCKRPVPRPEPEVRLFSKELGEERKEFEYGAGCDACGNTGYLGRVPVFELFMVTDAIRELVMKRAPASEILASGHQRRHDLHDQRRCFEDQRQFDHPQLDHEEGLYPCLISV